MSRNSSSRREFIRSGSLGLAALSLLNYPFTACTAAEMTIGEALNHIITQIPGGERSETVDTLKTGDPAWPLRGIATTFMATIPVIQKAIDQGVNLIVTHEPTFYNHLDETDWLAGDPVYAHKKQLLETHQIAVWRFHDYWHRFRPDGIQTGFLQAVEWEGRLDPARENVVSIPPIKLRALAGELAQKLGLTRTFYIGDPELECQKVGLLPGSWGREPHIRLLQEDVEVLVIGECNEWETAEYVRDAAAAGLKKGLIILGHAESEEPGMAYCQRWLADLFPQVKVWHLPAGDAFIPV